jgi:hypothetical protein
LQSSEEKSSERKDWPAPPCVQFLLPASAPLVYSQGMIGSLFLTRSAPLLYADFAALIFPGLQGLGVEAELLPLPNEPQEIVPFLQDLNRAAARAVFQFGGEPIPDNGAWEAEEETDSRPALQDRERTAIRQGLARTLGAEEIGWEDSTGQAQTATPAEFRTLFSYGIRLRRAAAKGTRRVNLAAAIQRAVVYGLAFPDRVLTAEAADLPPRQQASQFLAEAAGRQQDPVSRRWRQASNTLAQGDTASAWQRLYEAALWNLNLPAAVFNALLASPEIPLTTLQQRELIYLARAGHRDLKVFASRRLTSERGTKSVRQTLDQLALSPDPLVRAAASVRE